MSATDPTEQAIQDAGRGGPPVAEPGTVAERAPVARPPSTPPTPGAIRSGIGRAMLADVPRLRARWRRLTGERDGGGPRHADRREGGSDSLRQLARDVDESIVRRLERAAKRPICSYNDELPICQRREEIAAAIRGHQVVVLCGETGSGKTTQLPKICLDLGLGAGGLIGHTQPRRIAARSVAARIAEELDTPLGQAVGYKVRFGDRTGPETYVKLMTDGILLAETPKDRYFRQYEALIIDEAHERSLNIDFLLGYLRQVLDKRRDLKVIITSATIDPERFARHFAGLGGCGPGEPAPIIEVSGRTYPVEVRYRPLRRGVAPGEAPEDQSVAEGVLDAMTEIEGEGPGGDVLVFMPGEREIRLTSHALRGRYHDERRVEVLPLYARLSNEEQNRVFRAGSPGKRRIVIATNVAETSLTVPGIRYVIDPGTARISRYSARSKLQGLPVEPVSRASADQRKGRCGRVGPGVCIRLYGEEDYLARELFTAPEILRTNLASVILQMTHLRLGRPEEFPFVEPPDSRLIRDGYDTLRELGAIDDEHGLTALGSEMARLPVDPRVARIVLAGREENCLDEAIVIAAGLSVQDPRERPIERAAAADEAHEKFAHAESDFMSLLNIWDFFHEQHDRLSRSKLAKACAQNFLSERRLREWWDVARQVKEMVGELRERGSRAPLRTPLGEKADYDAVHRALLAGLLSNVGYRKEGHEYTGMRGTKFVLHPGSVLFEGKPRWIVSGEIVRTTKLYARMSARIDPVWIEKVGVHLVRRKHVEPRWNAGKARVDCTEKVLLGELEVVPQRAVHYGPINPAESRKLFIWHGLVEGEMDTRNPAVQRNRALEKRIALLEDKARRRDLLAEAEARFAFYDKRLPQDVYSGERLDRWWKTAREEDESRLDMSESDLLIASAEDGEGMYPDAMGVSGSMLPLKYRYDPGAEDDGVTLEIPLEMLAQVDPERCDQLVPGLLREKVLELIKTLPRSVRRNFDAGAVAAKLSGKLAGSERPLLKALADELSVVAGVVLKPTSFDAGALPAHLQMRYRVLDPNGKELAAGRDLSALRDQLSAEASDRFESFFGRNSSNPINRDGIRSWDFDELAESVQATRHGRTITGYPALIDRGTSVSIRVLESRLDAERQSIRGLCRLSQPALKSDLKLRASQVPGIDRLRLAYAPLGPASELDDCLMMRLAERLFFPDGVVIRHHGEFMAALDLGWSRLSPTVEDTVKLFEVCLTLRQEVASRLEGNVPEGWKWAVQDCRDQLANLAGARFVMTTPWEWLRRVPVYMRAMLRRLERLRATGPQKDLVSMREVYVWIARFNERVAKHNAERVDDAELGRFRWLIEEFRVSLYAQELGTVEKVSAKRLEEAWARVRP